MGGVFVKFVNDETRERSEHLEVAALRAKSRARGPTAWILSHLFGGRHWAFVGCWVIASVSADYVNALVVLTVGSAIDAFRGGDSSGVTAFSTLVLVLGLAFPLLKLVENLLRETLAQRLERDSRREFFASLLTKSQTFHDGRRVGDLVARATDDVRLLNYMVSPALSLILSGAVSTAIPLAVIAARYPPQLLVAPLAFVAAFVVALRRYVGRLAPVTLALQAEFGRLDAVLSETLDGVHVVKGSAAEDAELAKYEEVLDHWRALNRKEGEIQARYVPLLLVALTITAGLVHGVVLAGRGALQVGAVVAYVGLLFNLRFPTFISIWAFRTLSRARAGAKRLLEVMTAESGGETDERDAGPAPAGPEGGGAFQVRGHLTFREVWFTYPGATSPTLRGVSFDLPPGKTLAVVGTTGAGKTTLAKLVSRLYEVDSGQILLDGVDVREVPLSVLRTAVAHIEQDVFLFSTSVEENVTFGRKYPHEEVERAVRLAQAHEFVEGLPGGYSAEVGERGVRLSGGERQRLAIARAFLSDPRVLILDDATSSVDSATEERIQRAIAEVRAGRTTLLITHRLSQVRWANQVLVLRRGEVVARGTHEQLLRESPEYRKIFVKRFDVPELWGPGDNREEAGA
ncbi:MAG: ABC transporter ATP-binding protein [Promethearchaeota archaeon]